MKFSESRRRARRPNLDSRSLRLDMHHQPSTGHRSDDLNSLDYNNDHDECTIDTIFSPLFGTISPRVGSPSSSTRAALSPSSPRLRMRRIPSRRPFLSFRDRRDAKRFLLLFFLLLVLIIQTLEPSVDAFEWNASTAPSSPARTNAPSSLALR